MSGEASRLLLQPIRTADPPAFNTNDISRMKEIKPVHEEQARIQMKCGGSGGKEGRMETAARENGNAKYVFVLL